MLPCNIPTTTLYYCSWYFLRSSTGTEAIYESVLASVCVCCKVNNTLPFLLAGEIHFYSWQWFWWRRTIEYYILYTCCTIIKFKVPMHLVKIKPGILRSFACFDIQHILVYYYEKRNCFVWYIFSTILNFLKIALLILCVWKKSKLCEKQKFEKLSIELWPS